MGRSRSGERIGVVELISEGFSFLEAPVYDRARERLIFGDYEGGGIWSLDDQGDVSPVIHSLTNIGGMALHASGGLVLAGRSIVWTRDGAERTLARPPQAPGVKRYNDIAADREGRIYAGSIDFDPAHPGPPARSGFLHLVDLDGSVHELAEGIRVSNGIGLSPDGALLYQVDSMERIVWRYGVHADGSVGDRDPLLRWGENEPKPDGLAVAADGAVWVARHEAGISVLEPDGITRTTVPIPDGRATSLCFGGPGNRTLFVVTGGPRPHPSGRIYRVSVEVPGAVVMACRVNPDPSGSPK